MPIELIDSHCHLDMEPFQADFPECLERARIAGISRIITIGTGDGLSGAHKAIALAERHPMIWASVGVHPHSADESYDPVLLEQLATHDRVVAIGETGLDFYRDWAPSDKQYAAFEMQVEIAKRAKKPLIIHSRQAGAQSLELLLAHNARDVGGVFHCFSEDASFAGKLREIGFYVSFPGQITFKKADAVRSVCKEVPIDQILVETDGPFLAPEPYRGKRCEPAFVLETARMIATVKGLSLEEVAEITTRNTLTLFSQMR